MKVSQFEKAFRLGLGRAYIHVKEHGDEGLQDIILHHCLNNPCYDPQCEDSRTSWLMSVVDNSHDPKFYYKHIISSLSSESDCWNLSQLFKLCLILAQRGNKEAEAAIFSRHEKQDFDEDWQGNDEIVDLKGLDGLAYVAGIMGQKITDGDGYDWDGGAYFHACDTLGEDKVYNYLKGLSENEPLIKLYLQKILDHQKFIDEPTAKSVSETMEERVRREFPLKRVLEEIEKGKFHPGALARFGKYATDDEIDIIYKKLLGEEREKQLISYLLIFRRREIPSYNQKIKNLIFSDNERLRFAAINALSGIKSDDIRHLAISLHDNAETDRFAEALSLLTLNYRTGDYKYIDRVLVETEDDDLVHGIGLRVIDIFEGGHFEELKEAMLWVYENTPCAYCRSEVVRNLSEENMLSDYIKEEGRYDCCEDTKKLCA